MKNRILAMILCTVFTFTAAACGGNSADSSEASKPASEQAAADDSANEDSKNSDSSNEASANESTLTDEHGHVHDPSTGETIEQDEYTVELTLPAEYIGDATQEQLSQTAADLGYKSITLHDDGSATYIMTEAQHETMLSDMKSSLNKAVVDMIGSADYPSFSNITVNDDFTKFMITTINTECTAEENQALFTLIGYSGIYHIFKGEVAEGVRVDIVNMDSNDIIYYYDSAEAQAQ